MSKLLSDIVVWNDTAPPSDILGKLKVVVPEGYRYRPPYAESLFKEVLARDPVAQAMIQSAIDAKPSDTTFDPFSYSPLDDDEEEEDEEEEEDDGYYDDDDWIDGDEEEEEDDEFLDAANTPSRLLPAFMLTPPQSSVSDSVVQAINAMMAKLEEEGDRAWRTPIFTEGPADALKVMDDAPVPCFIGLMAMIEQDEQRIVAKSLNVAGSIVGAMAVEEDDEGKLVRMPELGETWMATEEGAGKTKPGRQFKIVRTPTEKHPFTYGVRYLDDGGSVEIPWSKGRFRRGEAVFFSGTIDLSRFPHKCPRCQSAAYQGGGPTDIDCTNKSCHFYRGAK